MRKDYVVLRLLDFFLIEDVCGANSKYSEGNTFT